MTSLKPYLIRSIYEWIVDNHLTPHILVNAEVEECVLPHAFVQDGRITLNLRPEAVQGLSLGNDDIEFNARFNGQPMHVKFPVKTVLAIYAKESGKGMIFDQEGSDNPPPAPASPDERPGKPFLKIVK